MESTRAHRMEAMPSDGLRRRHRHRPEAKTMIVDSLLGGRTFSLQLDLSETIAEVKAMIHEQGGAHPMQQVLIFTGERLNDDHRTLADYGVQHSWGLLLATRRRHPPEKEGTESYNMETMASEGLRRPCQGAKTVVFKNVLHEVITVLELDLSETIADVKAMICEKTGILYDKMIINGRHADKECCTLEEYGFQYGTIIYVTLGLRGGGVSSGPEMINIFVKKLDGEIFTITVTSLMSLSEVRTMIHLQQGIRWTEQHLVFCGQTLDNETLAHYKIQENSTLHLAPGPRGIYSGLHEDEEAACTYDAAVDESSSHSHDQEGQSSESQSQALVLCHHEAPPSMVVNDTVPLAHEFTKHKQQEEQIRWSKYSVKVLVFAITTLVTYLGSTSTLFSTGSMVFKISIGAFFITDAILSIMMPPKIGGALLYLSCFLLVLVSYLLLISFNKYYAYAILPLPLLPIIIVLFQHKLLPGLKQHRMWSNNIEFVIEFPVEAHDADEEGGQRLDSIFELSSDIVNCGGLITVVFGNSMVGPVSALGFLFFYTVSLGLYLMMVTTVRTVVLTAHARYMAILLKVLLVITLITALIRGVRH